MSLLARYEAATGKPVGKSRPLLLDASGSMAELLPDGKSKWVALTEAIHPLHGERMAFNSAVMATLPESPSGTTAMHLGFAAMRSRSRSFILVTDGMPDNPRLALDAARGLHIDIIYVGPHPRPSFLDDLARQCGGSAKSISLESPAALASGVRALVEKNQ